MTKTTVLRALFAGAGVAAAGAMGMAVASADDGTQANLGGAAQLVDGGTVQQWTVGGLRPSGDVIDYAPAGSLWEATATNTSVAGGNIPFVPGFSARGGADSYPVLWGVASPQGVNPAGLAPGQSSTGKLYFDVTGASPDRVAFSDGGHDLAVWVTPPPPPAAAGGGSPATVYSPPASGGAAAAPAATAPAAPAAPAPAASGSQGTPAPAATGSQGTPLPATGSQGTPLPAGSTPAPASAAPASTPAATPAPASQAPASQAPASQAPASSSATATPAPASGSQGTPLTAPTTTAVPAPGA